jgi:outer membrane lipoprotein-sorting protein
VNILRRLPLPRLVLLCAAVLVVGASAAVAAFSAGGGPKPAAQRLPDAIHAGLAAPPVQGVSADITFTNKLVAAASLQQGGRLPVLTGAHGRVWVSNDGHIRLELQSNHGDTEIYYDGKTISYYDTSTSTLYRLAMAPGAKRADAGTGNAGPGTGTGTGTGKAGTGKAGTGKTGADNGSHAVPTVAKIQQELTKLMGHVDVSGAIPSDVGGQPTYKVQVTPSHAAGLLGAAQIEWDSAHGIPLRIAIYAADQKDPVLELKATNISYGPLSAASSAFNLPRASKVVDVKRPATPSASAARHARASRHRPHATGARAVQAALPFKLSAPATLDGLPRQQVQMLDWGGSPAALVTYGQNLGGIAVIERQAKSDSAKGGKGAAAQVQQAHGATASLPKISINGSTGSELSTPLGTFVQFDRAGVSYVVLGSVPHVAAEAAARGL